MVCGFVKRPNKKSALLLGGKNLKSEAASFPSWIRRFCMPNWSLAACGDWPHYKEAPAVSCWCLTCKSCWSKRTLCRGRQRCTGTHASPVYTHPDSNCLGTRKKKKCRSTMLYLGPTFLCRVWREFVLLLHAVSWESSWPEKEGLCDEDKDLSNVSKFYF